MRVFYHLLLKDLRNELRKLETLTLLVSLSLLLAVISSVGINAAFLDPNATRKVFTPLVWITFVFVAALSIGRSYEYETEHDAIGGLLVGGASPSLFYLAKVTSNAIVVFLSQCFNILFLALALDVSPPFVASILITCLVTVGYCALATLLAGISAHSRLKGMLLPILLLPLLFPLFFCATELGSSALVTGSLNVTSFWFTLLLFLDLLYLSLGTLLIPFVLRE